ncbi:MAG: hypothetical protein MJ071_02095 [Oscillospiraceae bacterium]|nr:hypothetical protein [Oscillospiraceae bacterium]
MIYCATRTSRSEGFRWDDGTPQEYQRASDTLMGCSISDKPYYVICGHTPLRVTISKGQKVDSRENRLYTAEELMAAPEMEYGLQLLSAIISGANGQGTVVFRSVKQFEGALCYAAQYLPRSRTTHVIISENVPESGTTMLLVYGRETSLLPVPEWMQLLPRFADSAEPIAKSEGGVPLTYDMVYDVLVQMNSHNHNIRILSFIAFACGGEADVSELMEYTAYMQSFQPTNDLIFRYFCALPDDQIDPVAVLPILYGMTGTKGEHLLAEYVREYLPAEKLHRLGETGPIPKVSTLTSSFAHAADRNIGGFSLAKASPSELFELYRYIRDRDMKDAALQSILAEDENSRSMCETVRAVQEKENGDKPGKVSGILPAVLYWYDEINRKTCAKMYGSSQLAGKMMHQVKQMMLPKRMQKLEYRDDFYDPRTKNARLKDVRNLPQILLVALLTAVCLLFVGGVCGFFMSKHQSQPAQDASQSTTTTAAASDTALTTATETTASTAETTETTAAQTDVNRTQLCRLDAEEQAEAEAMLMAQNGIPEGWNVSQGVVYYSVNGDMNTYITMNLLPVKRYMIPYINAYGCGVICLEKQPTASLQLLETVPGPDAETAPSVWFDLAQIENDFSALTQEILHMELLLLENGPYRKLVFASGEHESYVLPYHFDAEGANGLQPLEEGKVYTLDEYLQYIS